MDLLWTQFGLFLAAVVGILIIAIVYARWNYGYLEQLGIPVVKPFLFFGSNYAESRANTLEIDIQRREKYGSIYGVYDGRCPQICISDPKLIRLITTVDFDHFRNHGWDFGQSSSVWGQLLNMLEDEKWKTVRNALTPIFTTGKIKLLNTISQSIAEDYAQTLMAKCQRSNGRYEKMDFEQFIGPMILEILCKCFCGVEIPNAKDPNNEFIKNMKAAISHANHDWGELFLKIFPIILRLSLKTLDMLIQKLEMLIQKLEMLMQELDIHETLETFESHKTRVDFLVSTLENILATREESGQESIDATAAFVDMMNKVRTDAEYNRLGITKNTVLAQARIFFSSGYAGIGHTFKSCIHEMAKNPEIQESVFAEIDALPHLTLDAISNNLPLMTAAITETLRMHLLVVRPDRKCNEDLEYEGIRIPKGTQVVFPVAALHFNPDYYPDPYKFDPWRFMGDEKKSRDPYTNFTFGHGPRNCIGQRFAMETLKILVATFLKKFKIVERSDTSRKLELGGDSAVVHEPDYVDVWKR